jgi:SAM-dependent methyltransferase
MTDPTKPAAENQEKLPWYATYFGRHYLDLYSSHLLTPEQTKAEAEFVIDALALAAGESLLDVPCGFGRHLQHFSSAGCHVAGVDLNPSYLKRARDAFPSRPIPLPALAAADMSRLPFASGTFDAIANLFNSFGYFPDDSPVESGNNKKSATNSAVLAELARILKPGGRLLIDIADRDALLEAIAESPRARFAGSDWEVREEWRYLPETGRIENQTQFIVAGDCYDCGYTLRAYNRAEIENEVRSVGLIPTGFWGEMESGAADKQGDRLILTARKPAH